MGKENRSHKLVKWETGDELITGGFVHCDMFRSLLFYDSDKENCGLRSHTHKKPQKVRERIRVMDVDYTGLVRNHFNVSSILFTL